MTQETFNWEEARKRMHEGKFVARKTWVELEDMYIWCYVPAAKVSVAWCKEPHLKRLAERNGGFIECLEVIRMKFSDNKVKTGWFPDQTDIKALD